MVMTTILYSSCSKQNENLHLVIIKNNCTLIRLLIRALLFNNVLAIASESFKTAGVTATGCSLNLENGQSRVINLQVNVRDDVAFKRQ